MTARQQLDTLLQYLYDRKDVARAIDIEVIKSDIGLLKMADNNSELERMLIKLRDDKHLQMYPDYPLLPDGKKDMSKGLLTYCSITFDGRLFYENGGYTQEEIKNASENDRIKANEKAILLLTFVLSVVTLPTGLASLADLYHKYNWFQSGFWWTLVVVVAGVCGVTTYLIIKLLLRKKRQP